VVYRLPSVSNGVASPESSRPPRRRLTTSHHGRRPSLVDAEIAGTSRAPIELNIAGVKRLKIVVDYGQNLDTGDWLNLRVRIVK
jgi:hypothetical protein